MYVILCLRFISRVDEYSTGYNYKDEIKINGKKKLSKTKKAEKRTEQSNSTDPGPLCFNTCTSWQREGADCVGRWGVLKPPIAEFPVMWGTTSRWLVTSSDDLERRRRP